MLTCINWCDFILTFSDITTLPPSPPPQMVAPSSSLPVWPTRRRLRSWSEPSWSPGSERWKRRTDRSGCSSASRRAPPPRSSRTVTTVTSSGGRRRTRALRTGTTQRRRRATTQSVPDRPPSRSVRSGSRTSDVTQMLDCSYRCDDVSSPDVTSMVTLKQELTHERWVSTAHSSKLRSDVISQCVRSEILKPHVRETSETFLGSFSNL